jgi:hypothetical protein
VDDLGNADLSEEVVDLGFADLSGEVIDLKPGQLFVGTLGNGIKALRKRESAEDGGLNRYIVVMEDDREIELIVRNGRKGERGEKGEQGERGERGPQGEQGAVGPAGPRGPQGEIGAVGPVGPCGPKGDRGDRGDKGEQGIPGPVGETGPQGKQGSRIISPISENVELIIFSMPSGEKRYYVDKSNFDEDDILNISTDDFIILESQLFKFEAIHFENMIKMNLIANLKGDKGEQGDKGDQGIKGDKGDQGIQGIQGAKGDKGDTPVKGVDYFTEEDIESLPFAKPSNIPTKVSQLANDVKFVSSEPIATKTFTNLYTGANSYRNGKFPLITIKPKDPENKNGVYWIRLRWTVSASGYDIIQCTDSIIHFYNTGNYQSYANWNYRNLSGNIMNNIYMYYKDRTTFEDVGTHICAYISSGYNYDVAANARTVKLDVLEISEDLTFEFEESDTPIQVVWSDWYMKYSNWSSAYQNCTDAGLQEVGNLNYYNRVYVTTRITTGNNYRVNGAGLIGYNADGKTIPISYRGTASTTKEYTIANGTRVYNTTEGFDWKAGLFYNSTSTVMDVNSTLSVSLYLAISGVDLRYSDNVVASNVATNTLGLLPDVPVYLRGVIKEDGLFYLRPRTVTYGNNDYYATWIQEIDYSDTKDAEGYNYCYWKISNGYLNSSYNIRGYQITLITDKPMYTVKDGKLVNYEKSVTVEIDDTTKDKIKSDILAEVEEASKKLNAIAFKSGDNIGEVLLDFFAKSTPPQFQQFYSKEGTITSTLTNKPSDLIRGFFMNAYCLTDQNVIGTPERPAWNRTVIIDITVSPSNSDATNNVDFFKYVGKVGLNFNTVAESYIKPTTYPNIIWQKIATDMFNYNKTEVDAKIKELSDRIAKLGG